MKETENGLVVWDRNKRRLLTFCCCPKDDSFGDIKAKPAVNFPELNLKNQ